ncbi:hypothetical protein [Petrocella sp. FN5]|uniref:hypothetical protein n=1 Tax=Petrocella sp. FN5 TaxID=3032002 RepID=UPI0023DA3809|nr:hypothetical protein [Petrocella sp. FN5]MDF1616872.1 hypothetical protein [Petrocella sp. FN5]
MKRAVFEIKRNAVGQYFFVFKKIEGNSAVVSMSFSERSSLEHCLSQVREKSKIACIVEASIDQDKLPQFLIRLESSGYAFYLIGFECEIILASEHYEDKEPCIQGILALKALSYDAGILDLTD